jgi:hypothetical protein
VQADRHRQLLQSSSRSAPVNPSSSKVIGNPARLGELDVSIVD